MKLNFNPLKFTEIALWLNFTLNNYSFWVQCLIYIPYVIFADHFVQIFDTH